MAITKIQSESMNLADTYAFTGTVTGAGESNAPSFSTSITSDQTFNNNTYTKIAFATEQYDTAGAYDTSNYKFTVPSGQAGKYNFSAFILIVPNGTVASNALLNLKINGTQKAQPFWFSGGASTNVFNSIKYIPITLNASYDLSVGDYVELFVYLAKDSGTGDTHTLSSGVINSHFSGFKISS
jgi:hypothetical protein|tara:strand:- start:25 stop:573 length:549 start_codon:yes stop_codon:yes gene_type:complete